MPLSSPTPRELVHTRALKIEIYRRHDGLWDIDALLDDTKTHNVPLRTGLLPAGRPIHHLLLRLTVDADANVLAAETTMDAVPFGDHCRPIDAAYRERLVGLNLLNGFRYGLRERLSGIEACIHLNELAIILPDVAAQVLPFENRPATGTGDGDSKPFMLDNCHALRSDGPAVAQYYPRWSTRSPD